MLGFDYSYTCHSFLIGKSPYSSWCNDTCQNWHFPIPINIAKYSNFIILCCVFSNAPFLESYGIIVSSCIDFFDKSFTQIKVCHTFNKWFFTHHVNTSLILCKSNHKHLVINPSYHTCIPFVLDPFPYNITYLPWFATSYNYTSLPYWWFGYSLDSVHVWLCTHCNSQYYLG
jgi:hypothetical protein